MVGAFGDDRPAHELPAVPEGNSTEIEPKQNPLVPEWNSVHAASDSMRYAIRTVIRVNRGESFPGKYCPFNSVRNDDHPRIDTEAR